MATIIGALVVGGGVCIVSAVPITVLILLHGFVLSILWGWFIVPTLNLPPLNLIQALGVTLVVSMLTKHQTNTKEEGKEGIVKGVAYALLSPFFFLGIGWVYHLFM